VQAPAASPGPASATPHVPVSALAVHIAQQASNGARRFDIRLDPPELGRIEVRLDVSRDGQVNTHLIVERAETLDLLQRDARQLERALQDACLNTSEDDMKFTLKDQDLTEGEKDSLNIEDDKNAYANKGDDDDLSLFPDDAMPPPTRYLATSGLDIRI
jgi:flagellar hook-length control protein FliK